MFKNRETDPILYLRTPSSLERGEMAYDGRRIEPSCLSSSGPAASKDKNQKRDNRLKSNEKLVNFTCLFYCEK
jgi:hypothetical protein